MFFDHTGFRSLSRRFPPCASSRSRIPLYSSLLLHSATIITRGRRANLHARPNGMCSSFALPEDYCVRWCFGGDHRRLRFHCWLLLNENNVSSVYLSCFRTGAQRFTAQPFRKRNVPNIPTRQVQTGQQFNADRVCASSAAPGPSLRLFLLHEAALYCCISLGKHPKLLSSCLVYVTVSFRVILKCHFEDVM